METKYFTVTETAGLIRAALKAAFPAVKFGVRSSKYAGGASVAVSWTDGPTHDEVERIAKAFEGATFDGQTDLMNYIRRDVDGVQVRYGADFVNCTRHMSADLLSRAVRRVAVEHGIEIPSDVIQVTNGGSAFLSDGGVMYQRIGNGMYTVQDTVYQTARVMRPNGIVVRMKVGA
jgi:hypothetical protein